MRITKEKTVSVEELVSIKCDICGTEYSNNNKNTFEIQEFLHINMTGGYGSVIGDGTNVQVDVCQYCFKKMFEKYWREKEVDGW